MIKTLKLKKIVVKIGTKVLTGKGNRLDKVRMKQLVNQISTIINKGIKAVIVSSGAVGSGMGLLKLKERPKDLSQLQACAAVGQPHLMQAYDNLFKPHGLITAQVLLTQEDLDDRKRYLNAKQTLLRLLDDGVVPIINENDTVSTEEIKFGDNDKLSSLVANLIEADLLILVSDVDGLYKCDKFGKREKRPIAVVNEISSEIESLAQKSKDELGTGGMISKIQAANIATSSAITCVIVNGKKENILLNIIEGKQEGTLFLPSSVKLAARKRWLGFGVKPKGKIKVDTGAKEALAKGNKSLLSSGIIGAEGEFKRGDIVKITDTTGKEFARGIANYSSLEIEKIKGLKTAQIAKALGYQHEDEVVHRDNLVIV